MLVTVPNVSGEASKLGRMGPKHCNVQRLKQMRREPKDVNLKSVKLDENTIFYNRNKCIF